MKPLVIGDYSTHAG